MTTIAFIGLGIMGSPMAVHLQNAGLRRRAATTAQPERTQPLVDAGGRGRDSIAEAVKDADVVAVMVPDSPDVAGRARRRGRRLRQRQAGHAGHRLLQHPPRRDRRARRRRPRSKGFRLLDAPVSGGEAGAKNAALSIMVGGDAADFAEAEPVLDAVGKTVVHVGPQRRRPDRQGRQPAHRRRPTSRLLAEALVFLEAYGVDTEAALEVLGGGLAGSKVLDQKKANMLEPRRSTPASGSTCTTRTWASSPRAAREAGVVSRSARSSPS